MSPGVTSTVCGPHRCRAVQASEVAPTDADPWFAAAAQAGPFAAPIRQPKHILRPPGSDRALPRGTPISPAALHAREDIARVMARQRTPGAWTPRAFHGAMARSERALARCTNRQVPERLQPPKGIMGNVVGKSRQFF